MRVSHASARVFLINLSPPFSQAFARAQKVSFDKPRARIVHLSPLLLSSFAHASARERNLF